jgi:hypothetical protein
MIFLFPGNTGMVRYSRPTKRSGALPAAASGPDRGGRDLRAFIAAAPHKLNAPDLPPLVASGSQRRLTATA